MKISTLFSRIPLRLRFLGSLFLMLVLLFVAQKVVFLIYNGSMAERAPFFTCVAALWHGLRLDIATACYLLVVPVLVTLLSLFVRIPLRRVLVPYYVLICLVFTLAFAVDMVLYSYWGAKPDANDLIYAAQPKEMLAGLPVWFTIVGFIVVGLLVWGCVMLLRWVTPKTIAPLQAKPSFCILHSTFYILLSALLFLGMRGGLSESTANPSYAYYSSYPFCNHAALNPTFNMFHSLFKMQDLGKEFDSMPEEDVDAQLGDIFEPDATLADTVLRIERPNVLLVIWEGGGNGMVGDSVVAPNLQRLRKEGLYFSHAYANNYRTDRGLVSILSGWLGLPTATLMKRPDLCRHLPSIASSLKAEGYATSMTFGGDIDYTNMRMYFLETGFTQANGGETFPKELYSSAWGVPDEYTLTSGLIPSQRPFFSAILTLSSHEPWEVDYHRLADERQNAFAYTDSCLGIFVDNLKALPLWDSLLVIVVPDHGAVFLEGQSSADVRVSEIPILWLGGALAKTGEFDGIVNQSDIAATLLAQMHLDITPFVFSRNVFGTKFSQRKPFATHAVKNRLNYITPDGTASYDCVSRTLDPSDPASQHFLEALLQRLYKTSASLSSR